MPTDGSAHSAPTWAPNLSKLEHERLTSYYNFASGPSAAHAEFHIPATAHVKGVLIDEVSAVGPLITNDIIAMYRAAQAFGASDSHYWQYNTAQSHRDASIWVLTLGDLRDRWLNLEHVPELEEAAALFQRCEKDHSVEGLARYRIWHKLLVTHLGHERFFTTTSGRFGSGPASAQPGNKLSVLLGYNYPVLLRPNNTEDPNTSSVSFKVVGPTYTHGLMEGQAILGPIPAPWKMVIQNPDKLQSSFSAVAVDPTFRNSDTGEDIRQDPRLGPLPSDWEQIDM